MEWTRPLSIDGGIRGSIPVAALVKLEHATGRLTCENYAFVIGTSTGAIIADTEPSQVPSRPRHAGRGCCAAHAVATQWPP